MICVSLAALACGVSGRAPTAVDGLLDLSGWNFDADGDVSLVGTWEICWNQLLEPGEVCRPGWRPVRVRGIWSEEAVGSPFGGMGVATYRLRISLPPGTGSLSLAVGSPYTAHRLWIDGVDRGRVGIVGRTAETTVSGVSNRVYELEPGSSEVDLQLQVANFVFRGGGLRRLWYVGQAESIQRGIGLAILREGTLFAVGVVIGLGFLVLFALRSTERSRGYFGMMALALGLRAVPASLSTFGELVAPWLTWELVIRLEYLGAAFTGFAFAGYARTKVAGIMPPRTMNGLQLAAIAFGLIVAFAPMPIALASLPAQWAFSVILIGLIILCYGRAWTRGVPGVGITAATAVLYVGFVAHDIVRSILSDVGAPLELFPYAIVLWIFAEAFQLLQAFHQSFEQVELLSGELSDANFELQETEAAIVRFVPFDFLRTLGKDSIREVHAGDHARSKMSVLHCGFHLKGNVPDRAIPENEFERVNNLVGRLEPCIDHHDGFLNDYRGDGFQAFFAGGAADAVASACEILEAAREFNNQAASSGRLGIDVGIGIDTGWIQLGTIGSGEHLLRGVVGEPVNVARRIEALAARTEGKVLISAATREGLGEACRFTMRAVEGAEIVVGAGTTGVYEILGER